MYQVPPPYEPGLHASALGDDADALPSYEAHQFSEADVSRAFDTSPMAQLAAASANPLVPESMITFTADGNEVHTTIDAGGYGYASGIDE